MNQELIKISYEWLETKKLSVKQSSYAKYRNILEIHIIPFFKEHNGFNNQIILEYFNDKKKGKMSVSILRSIKNVMSNVFRYAENFYDYKHIDLSFITIASDNKKAIPLTPHQQKIVVEYCKKHHNMISISMLLGLYGGLRIGEIAALQWEDVNLEEGIIYVNNTVERIQTYDHSSQKTKLVMLEPKSISSKRQIFLPDFLVKELKSYYGHHKYVIHNKKNPVDPRTLSYWFHKILSDAHFHQLRHSYATNCLKCEIDVKTISELMGHADVGITLNRYVHINDEYKKQQINKLRANM